MLPVRARILKAIHRPLPLATGAIAAGGLAVVVAAAGDEHVSGRSFGWGVVAAAGVVGAVTWLGADRGKRRRQRAQAVQDRVLEHSVHAVISTDEDGVIQTFSRGAEEMFRCSAERVTGASSLSSIVAPAELAERNRECAAVGGHETAAASVDSLLGQARAADAHAQREWTCVRADGSTFPARLSVTPLGNGRDVCGYLVIVTDTTQTRAAEQARREIDARLAKIASQVPGMVFQIKQGPDGRRSMPYASDGIRDIFGVTPEVVAADMKGFWEAVHPDDRDRLGAAFADSAKNGTRCQCEFRAVDAHGTVRWLWGNALPEKQDDGSQVWHGFIADVTERKRAEQAHDQNREMLHRILSSVDLGVFLVDVLPDGDFRFVEVNPAYEKLTGISAAEIRGRTPQELVPVIPAEMAACLRASLRRGAQATGPVEYEEPFFVRGRLLWWLTRLSPLHDSTGRVVRLVGRSMDITERKAVELRVQSLTERLQLATEAAQVGIWDFDLVQNKLAADERLLALYGLEASTFDGSLGAWRERIHPDDRARADQELREAVEGRNPYNTSFRIVRPDGEARDVRARAHVQRNPAGRAVRMVAVHWDVTTERQAQAEIEFARDQAEDLNRQLEDALERAHRLAQEAAAATVAKSEFLANMSHEIRTPLNAIIGMSGFLLGTELQKDQREFAETIRSSGDGLLALVNDILDYSKIESGRLELEHRAFDLRDAIEAAVDVLAGRAAEKKLNLICSIDATVPAAINGDVMRLRQVIVNLLSNAVKFTARGEVLLTVGTQPAQDGGRVRLRFAVHDSGIGIPVDRMDRLFKTFSQVDASTTRQYGGTGLGLAISKRIVELMDGRIWAESIPGKGSTFCFEIEVPPAPAPTRPYAVGRVPALEGRRLLIIDDNATCCRVLCQQTVIWGMVPRAAGTIAEAMALLQKGEKFDLLLVDYELGDANGLQVANELRRVASGPAIPVAMMTVPGQPRLGRDAGVAGTVNKPVKTGALYDLLCDVLQGKSPHSSPATDRAAAMGSERPLTILLAEDNPVNQRVATLMLQRLGYKADVVSNGREAVDAAVRQRYDLVLMDVQMPEMDGMQASREICAKVGSGHRPRIVAMTANASVGDRDRCLEAGMSDFLTKPVRAEDLRRALEDTPMRVAATAP